MFISGAEGLNQRLGYIGLVKSDTLLPKARHRCNISLKGAMLHEHNDVKMGQQTRYTFRRNAANIFDLKTTQEPQKIFLI